MGSHVGVVCLEEKMLFITLKRGVLQPSPCSALHFCTCAHTLGVVGVAAVGTGVLLIHRLVSAWETVLFHTRVSATETWMMPPWPCWRR